MFTIKNAIKNIYRYKRLYKLLGIFYIIIICSASISVNIFSFTEKSIEELGKEYCGTLILKSSIENKETLTKESFTQHKNSMYVEHIRLKYVFSTGQLFSGPQPFLTERYVILNTKLGIKKINNLYDNAVYVIGYDFDDLKSDQQAKFAISKGRIYENDDECIIGVNSKIINEEWNQLDIGDIITITADENLNKEYTVVGILQENETIKKDVKTRVLFTTFESALGFESTVSNSNIVTMGEINDPLQTKLDANIRPPDNVYIEGFEVLVHLKSYKYYRNFQSEMYLKGYTAMPLYYEVNNMINLFDNLVRFNILFIISVLLLIILITIITILIMLNIRKYEMAVLRSIGMKKSRLILNYLIEYLVFIWGITLIAFISAQFITPIFSKNVFFDTKNFLSAEIFEQLTKGVNILALFQNMGLVFSGMTAVVMLSLILACINIVRFEPLKIFKNQY